MRGGAFVDFREVKAPDKSTFGCLFRVLLSKGAFVAGAFLKIRCSVREVCMSNRSVVEEGNGEIEVGRSGDDKLSGDGDG